MQTFKDTTVLITGASSGIGRACARRFAAAGARLLLVARRQQRLESVSSELSREFGIASHRSQLDVRNRKEVEQWYASLPAEWRSVEVLVNNAGLSRGLDRIAEGSMEDWDEMIDTNVKGLLYVTRAVLPDMVRRRSGTVVNIGSIAGEEVYPGGNVYCASKHAVDAITRGLRMELVDTPLRVCTVDPGLVETEFSVVRFRGDTQRARKVYQGFTPLSADDVADAVLYCAAAPKHVQIARVVILPTAQASTTIVHRTTSN